jgi:RNase P subunit RPR2
MECIDCHARVIGGEKLHEMRITSGAKSWVEWRCRECAEAYAADFWPEDYGPCPYQQHAPGRC